MNPYRIQYILYKKNIDDVSKLEGDFVTIHEIDSPRSLDEFDINVIDLSQEEIWRYNGNSIGCLNCLNDLQNLGVMISNTRKAQLVVLLPQDCELKFFLQEDYIGNEYYENCIELKNHLEIVINMVSKMIDMPYNCLIFEKTETTIGKYQLQASYHFNSDYIYDELFLTKSNISQKYTTIKHRNYYLSTLKINTYDELLCFLDKINLIKLVQDIPEWISSMHMFNDEEQINTIATRLETIRQCNSDIEVSQNIINKNNRYKSILYTNGEELVTVVFEMLEKMLSYDLSKFIDEKKEDFLISLENITFIGEIKGVTSNVKSEHISQLDVHYQRYMDSLDDKLQTVKVKDILIIDHQRSNELSKRQPVHENQIELAKRNGSLIIETITLLKLFEKFVKKDVTCEEIKEILCKSTGLLEIN